MAWVNRKVVLNLEKLLLKMWLPLRHMRLFIESEIGYLTPDYTTSSLTKRNSH